MSNQGTPSSDGAASYTKRYYDEYVLRQTEANRLRSLQRVSAVVEMCGDGRGSLLSVGAGKLNEPLAFKDAGFEVTTVDVASSLIQQARRAGLKAEVVNLETDPLPGSYDVVCCLEVLEHLVDPLGALRKLAGAVSAGGKLFVSLPEEFHLVSRLAVLRGRPVFSRYDWPHLRLFNLRSARQLFDAAGLEILELRHMPLLPPRMRRLEGLGAMLARIRPGLFSISHVFRLRPPENAT